MMGEKSSMSVPAGDLMTVVGQQFCAANPVDLTIVRKILQLGRADYEVNDASGDMIFQVKHKLLRERLILLDTSGFPIITLKRKKISLHRTWKVYKGDSKDSNDLLFIVRESSFYRSRLKLDVFLASNTNKDYCDFKVDGNSSRWSEPTCTIFIGNSSADIAKMQGKHGLTILGKDKLAVTVNPHVDYAFIVALVVIFEEIGRLRTNNEIKSVR